MCEEDFHAYSKAKYNLFNLVLAVFRYSGFRAIFLYRVGNKLYKKRSRVRPYIITRLIRATCNMDIELAAELGVGIRFPHPYAIIIGGKAKIGSHSTVMQCVTLGGNMGRVSRGESQPQVGCNVFIGPGAKLLGPVFVGNGAVIGANAVVIIDVPENSLCVGVPGKIKEKTIGSI